MKIEDIAILAMAAVAVILVVKSGKTKAAYATSPATITPQQTAAGVAWYQDAAPASWLAALDNQPTIPSGSLFNTGIGGGYLSSGSGASGGW